MDKIYYIYHIPTFIHKNGRIGKIGCSEEHEARVNKQGYTHYEILETHTDIMIASAREIELQKEYGYPVDCIPYYKSRSKWGSVAGKVGGKISGKKFAENGHMKRMAKLAGKKNAESGWAYTMGKIQGKKNIKSGHLDKIRKAANDVLKKPILGFTKEGKFIKEWESGSSAGRELNIDVASISKCCKGKIKSAGGYVWKYKEE